MLMTSVRWVSVKEFGAKTSILYCLVSLLSIGVEYNEAKRVTVAFMRDYICLMYHVMFSPSDWLLVTPG